MKYQYKEFGWIWNSEKTISTIIYGTGFVLDGKIVTSKHVVCGLALEDYQAIQGEDGNIVQFNKNVILEKLIESKVRIGGLGIEPERIYISSKYDLAFLKISSEALETLRLQKLNVSHEEMYVGKKVEAWGFPSTSNPQVNIDLKITSIKDDWFVLNQSLEPGFSGGPIIDQNNHVLGIISRSEAKQSRIIAANIMQVESDIFANGYGQGIMTLPNGEKYVGEFKDGLYHGQGTYTWPDGQKYVGEFKDGLYHGQGALTLSNGSKYVGEWKNGKANGQATITSPDGEKYVGEFKDGKMNGQGTSTLPNGQKYVGEWKDGLYHGQGALTLSNESKYVGEWKNGKENGQGTLTLPNGTKYVGEWKDGKMNGQGTCSRPNGEKYVGELKDSKMNGQGTFSRPDGQKFVGEFKDDKPHGQGTMTLPDGTETVGMWENGKYIGN